MRLNLAAVMMVLLFTAPALAQDGHSGEMAASGVEERLRKIEENQAEIYHTLSGKKEAGLASRIAERITLSGLLEVEGGLERLEFKSADADSASDLLLATAQLAIGVEVTENISGDISLLYEEGATDLEVDEAAIHFGFGAWSARLGQQYLPFGAFFSHFISDPLTLDLGETRDTALVLGYGTDLYAVSAFVFNGRADRGDGEDHLEDWGAGLILTPIEGLSLGGSYLSDLADTDAELLAEADSAWQSRVGGWSAFGVWEKGRLDISGEVLGAARSFSPGDLDADADGDGDRPLAWNLEAAWDLRDNLEIAFRLEGSREFFDQPERQYGVDLSWAPWERVSLSLEYLRGEFDPEFTGADESGRTPDRRDLVTAQVALEF